MASNLHYHSKTVTTEHKSARLGHNPCVVWLTGLSGSGKSTVANVLENKLFNEGVQTHVLDGDNVRMGLNKDLSFSPEDRTENIRRIGEVANLFSQSGTVVIAAFISPYSEDRARAREACKTNFLEVWVKASLDTCESRDPKGLYKKARRGELTNFTGIDSPYEAPENPEILIDTSSLSAEQSAERVVAELRKRGVLSAPDQ